MQNTNPIKSTIAFDQYVGSVHDILQRKFGRNAGSWSKAMIHEYFVRGCSADYCAWALARLGRPRLTP